MPSAPSPPGWKEEVKNRSMTHKRKTSSYNDDLDPTRVRRSSRPRSRSRSASTRPVQPGDEISLIDGQGSGDSEDYNWYDKDGMRVRVREI
jgi:hypothetical protein